MERMKKCRVVRNESEYDESINSNRRRRSRHDETLEIKLLLYDDQAVTQYCWQVLFFFIRLKDDDSREAKEATTIW